MLVFKVLSWRTFLLVVNYVTVIILIDNLHFKMYLKCKNTSNSLN